MYVPILIFQIFALYFVERMKFFVQDHTNIMKGMIMMKTMKDTTMKDMTTMMILNDMAMKDITTQDITTKLVQISVFQLL